MIDSISILNQDLIPMLAGKQANLLSSVVTVIDTSI